MYSFMQYERKCVKKISLPACMHGWQFLTEAAEKVAVVGDVKGKVCESFHNLWRRVSVMTHSAAASGLLNGVRVGDMHIDFVPHFSFLNAWCVIFFKK